MVSAITVKEESFNCEVSVAKRSFCEGKLSVGFEIINEEFADRKLDTTKRAVVKYKAILRLRDLMLGYIWFNKFKLGVLKPIYSSRIMEFGSL